MPIVHEIERHGDEHLTIWMEHVDDGEPWTLDRYRHTASALGALAGRWSEPDAVAAFGLHRRDIGRLFFGKVLHHDIPIQAADGFWADPVVAAAADDRHRADLSRLVEAVPRCSPHSMDAVRRVPRRRRARQLPGTRRRQHRGSRLELRSRRPVGSDLGQLFAGRFESGVADPADVAPVAATIFEGFLAGLETVDCAIRPDQVRTAWATHLAIRSVASLMILERDDLADERRADLWFGEPRSLAPDSTSPSRWPGPEMSCLFGFPSPSLWAEYGLSGLARIGTNEPISPQQPVRAEPADSPLATRSFESPSSPK